MLNAFAIAIDKTIHYPGKWTDLVLRPEKEGYNFIKSGNSFKIYTEGQGCGIMALEQIREAIAHVGPSSLEVVEAKFRQRLKS